MKKTNIVITLFLLITFTNTFFLKDAIRRYRIRRFLKPKNLISLYADINELIDGGIPFFELIRDRITDLDLGENKSGEESEEEESESLA